MGRRWSCSVCNRRKIIVVPNPPKADQIVQSVSNQTGLTLAYVCAFCTESEKEDWLGFPKEVNIYDNAYPEIQNLEFIFTNPSSSFATDNGKVCSYHTGNVIPNKGNKQRVENRFVITTMKPRHRRKGFSGLQIAQHYRRECLYKCPVCIGDFAPDNEQDHALKTLGKKYIKAEIEQKPTEQDIIDSATPEYFPDSHDDIQAYLDQAEATLETLQQPPIKKRKYDVKKELNSPEDD